MSNTNPMKLTQEELKTLSEVQTKGTTGIISNEQIDWLIQGMLKSSESAFTRVVDVVQKDTKLCSSISSRMNDIVESIITSNNELTKMEVHTYQMSMDAIGQFMKNPTDSSVTIKDCFVELRHYAQKIETAVQRNAQDNNEMHKRVQEINQKTIDRSKENKNAIFWGALGEAASPLLTLLFTTMIKNRFS